MGFYYVVVSAFNERARDPELAISVAAILVDICVYHLQTRQWMTF